MKKTLYLILSLALCCGSFFSLTSSEKDVPSLAEHLKILRSEIETESNGDGAKQLRSSILKADLFFLKKEVEKSAKRTKSKIEKYNDQLSSLEETELPKLQQKIDALQSKLSDLEEIMGTIESLEAKLTK